MDTNLSHTITHHPHLFEPAATPPARSHTPRSQYLHNPCFQSHSQSNLHLSSPLAVQHTSNVPAASRSVDAVSSAVDSNHHSGNQLPGMLGDFIRARNSTSADPQSIGTDLESQKRGSIMSGPEGDPFNLRSAYKTAEEMTLIKANTSRKRLSTKTAAAGEGGGGGGGGEEGAGGGGGGGAAAEAQKLMGRYGRNGIGGKTAGLLQYLPSQARDKVKAKRVTEFYESQNATIDRLLKTVEDHRAAVQAAKGTNALKFKIAVWGSLISNVVLSGIQLYAAISSGSLSLFATMADAVFDPMSNLTLILVSRAVRHVDERRFPSGKARLETVGNIVFCFLMMTVSVVIVCFSILELVKHEGGDTKRLHLPSVISVCCAFVTKLALFSYCSALRNQHKQVRILWQDHRNDLMVNAFGILTSVGGAKLAWWIDPSGAIILSVFVCSLWMRTALEEFLLLVGVSADTETQQLITYQCLTHNPDAIAAVDTVRVYHSGPRLIAEIDIVMDAAMRVKEAHDISESLQIKLERLPDIERAYVHVDYETTHKPEHEIKKEI